MQWMAGLTATLAMMTAPLVASANPLENTSWKTASGDAVIRIESCGQKTCGRIIASSKQSDQRALDTNNPNPTLRSRPIVGLPILAGFSRQADGTYKGGSIYSPDDGKTYRSEFKLAPNGTLLFKACLGPFCRTQNWTRVP